MTRVQRIENLLRHRDNLAAITSDNQLVDDLDWILEFYRRAVNKTITAVRRKYMRAQTASHILDFPQDEIEKRAFQKYERRISHARQQTA